jgi:hypothetical protein
MRHAGLRAGAPRLHLGALTATDPAKQNYIAVCALADKLFGRIREMVASQLVPTTLKVLWLSSSSTQAFEHLLDCRQEVSPPPTV